MIEDLAMHIADLIENSLRSGAKRVEVIIAKDGRYLHLEVSDDGCGIAEAQLPQVSDPFFTTKPGRRIGLGLALLRQTAEELGGSFRVESTPGVGTRVVVRIPWDHPDRPPLGDLGGTLVPLIATSPVEFRIEFRDDRTTLSLDTQELRTHLGDVPLASPEVLSFLEEAVLAGMASLGLKEEG